MFFEAVSRRGAEARLGQFFMAKPFTARAAALYAFTSASSAQGKNLSRQ